MSSAQQGIGGLHVSSNGGSGPPPGDVSLQTAYDGGTTIDEDNGPVQITAHDDVGLRIEVESTSPPGDQGAVEVLLNDTPAGSVAAFLVRHANVITAAATPVLRLLDALGGVWLQISGQQITMSSGDGTDTRTGIFETDADRPLTVRSGSGQTGAPGSTRPPASFGIGNGSGFGAGDLISGGIDVTPNGRITLRPNDQGVTVGSEPRGALRLHNIDTANDLIAPEEGDVYLRTDEGEVIERVQGFRGYRAGAYGMFCRVYQRTIDDGDLSDRIIQITHSLQTRGCMLAMWDNDGLYRPAGPDSWNAVEIDDQTIEVTFDTSVVPLLGQWRFTVGGV